MASNVVLVTGSNGMVGMNMEMLVQNLNKNQVLNPLPSNAHLDKFLLEKTPNFKFKFATRADADLTSFDQTLALFEKNNPTIVIHLAAKVGGLFANLHDKVTFFESNLQINMNVIKASHMCKVKRLVCMLSTCIYPDGA